MLIEMELREIVMKEQIQGSQIVVLGEKNGTREFPIYIGYFEANAMYYAVHGHQPTRPMTHDLVFNIVEGLDARLIGICIDDLRNDTFHGKLMLEAVEGRQVLVDARPSDAMVLAMKRQTPIFVEDRVLDAVSNRDLPDGEEEEDEPEL